MGDRIAEGIDLDRDGLGDANGVCDLHLGAAGEPRQHDLARANVGRLAPSGLNEQG